MTGPESLSGPLRVKPLTPPIGSHPGLKELWNGRQDREFGLEGPIEKNAMYYVRWKLFSWVVHPLADGLLFQDLRPEDLYMVCQLFFMQHEPTQPILAEFEVKAFILMHLRLKSMQSESEQISSLHLDFVPRPR